MVEQLGPRPIWPLFQTILTLAFVWVTEAKVSYMVLSTYQLSAVPSELEAGKLSESSMILPCFIDLLNDLLYDYAYESYDIHMTCMCCTPR